ncbi:sirohydrochlorin cobaltochelatase [Tepidibacter formicigenes]|jgi:sirohydrochlorin cobaltochelatase|uniref:Sirohydrochlorin cobaltochelatase n=1 Tax=Tepidibacter formicigenes DSM 15518 TaxID=1123349 RepID=A0A1M6S6N5_9FIRM|nr:sirohydrochlorin cobaltochelatase [Tepidibacter formicigenes]SHK40464.1 sirohydrochlorin cobaltochelatase [Tepidibacter formicigenes DSM 15518]
MKIKKCLALLLSLMLLGGALVGCTSAGAAENDEKEVKKDSNKKAVLVVSFGTSYADTRKVTIEACENKIDKAFPDYEMRRAFTSNIIIKKLKERDNIEVDTPKEALTKLKEEGFSEVVVQPLHIMNGAEYDDLAADVNNFKNDFDKLVMGNPLLTSVEDYKNLVEALKDQMPELKDNEAVVFMGHGTHHYANATYACLDYVLEDMGIRAYVGTVEGYPEIDNVIKKLKRNNIEKVTLMPLMLVAGDHANNDMAGDEEDSWKSILKKEGFVVETYLHGLGENEKVQDMYVEHAKEAMNTEKTEK